MSQRLSLYAELIRLDRPIGTLLLLWPTLWAVWIAGAGRPDPLVLLIFVIGTFLMRSAGCAVNDYADRKLDPQVARTRSRPLADGRLPAREAVLVFVVLALAAFALVLLLNRLTVVLSAVGLLLTAAYPFMKRFTYLPQAWLGISFAWGIPMAFAAQTGGVPGLAWWLVAATVCWVIAYDTMYAMVDREDDRKAGIRSSAIWFGSADRLVSGLLQLASLVLLVVVGERAGLGTWFAGGLVVAAAFAAWQQWLIAARRPADCFRAFLNNSWFGAAVFAGIVLDYLR
ncbi:MAG: 4-hydroxybenzoate octaprenyltransferase [Gammaproteobacteria bacterium]|nr:4-hydroxybenzoate octaprenyltransferase [Gammaproteobacteria bacterium]